MIGKLVILLAVVAVCKAGVAAPVVAAKLVETEFDPAPQYTYAYDVQDALTGDSKNQFETRNGDIVQGRYTLIEADGSRRIVDYTADPVNGFNAVVQREPLVAKVVASKLVAAPAAPVLAPAAPLISQAAPIVASSPVLTAARIATPVFAPARLTTPVAYTAPVAKIAAAPLLATSPFARIAAPAFTTIY